MDKIVLIGAGSAMFMREVIGELIARRWEAEVVLVDVNAEALAMARRLARKMVGFKNSPIRIAATTNRRRALRNATAVICTIGVGGRSAWRRDVEVARRHGIFMPVGDTAGPAGTARSLRMIPVMVDVARETADVAPDAVLFNHGNPMATICRAIDKAAGVAAVGLCHAVNDTGNYLRESLGASREQFSAVAAGINHLTWFVDVRVDGKDAMPRLRQLAATKAAENFDPLSWEMLTAFGAYPAAGDRHIAEFFPNLLREHGYHGKTLGVDVFGFEDVVVWGDGIFNELKQTAYSRKPLTDDFFRLAPEESLAVLSALRSSTPRLFSMTQPNIGQMPQMPLRAPVETPVLVGGGALRPVITPAMPAALCGLLGARFQWVECVVEAALENSRDKLIQALLLDGAVQSVDAAVALADDYISANGWQMRG